LEKAESICDTWCIPSWRSDRPPERRKTMTFTEKMLKTLLAAVFLGSLLPAQAIDPNTDATAGATIDATGVDAATGATLDDGSTDSPKTGTAAPRGPRPNLFGKAQPLSAHSITGFGSGGLLAAAGILGGIRFLDMMSRAHEQRDAMGIDDEDQIDAACAAVIRDTQASGQSLCWWHLGVLAAGEGLYLYDALTGISMMNSMGSGFLPGKIHKIAFFTHAGLMVCDVVLGFLLSGALERGDHEAVIAIGAAHAGIGIAIPIIVIGAGIAIEASRPPKKAVSGRP
jgi:hypothetical protein